MKKNSKVALISILIAGVIVFVIVLLFVMGKGTVPSQKGNLQNRLQPSHFQSEVVVNDVRFKLLGLKNLGNILKGKDAPYLKIADLKTSGKFLKVTVGVQNIGTKPQTFWFLSDIVDGEGRNFHTAWKGESWVPLSRKCYGRLNPTAPVKTCDKIFELPNDATGLKLKIEIGGKTGFLDLGI